MHIDPAVDNVALPRHVTRWKLHVVELCRVPSSNYHSTISWIGLDRINQLLDLVDFVDANFGTEVCGAAFSMIEVII